MAQPKTNSSEVTVVKKYANRRLYDTGRSSYVTLDDLCEMVKEGHDFIVVDAKSGDDITRSVLTQIIVDQESKGENLLPTNFLRNLISFYGDSIQGAIPNYLESTLDAFVKNQEQLREQMNKSLESMRSMSGMPNMEGMFPGAGNFEELNKQMTKSLENMRSMEGMFPGAGNLEELNKKNMEMFEKTMGMFSPFSATQDKKDS